MKQTVKTLLAALIAFSGATATLLAQNKTYTGSYPLEIIGKPGDATATYSYIDDYDLGRIYNGSFTLKWDQGREDGQGQLSGSFDHDKQTGLWTYSNKTYSRSVAIDITFSNGTLDGPCTYTYSYLHNAGDDRWVVKMNFKNGKIDGPFSITHFNRNDQPNAFLKGKVVQNYPAIGWEYEPYWKNSTETTFRFLGSDPDSPDKLEIRRFDTRTGSVDKELTDINRDYDRYLKSGIIPECVDSEFWETFSQALRLIDRLILRNSAKRNKSQRMSADLGSISVTDVPKIDPQPKPYKIEPAYDNKVYDAVEQAPAFPGGQAALLQYVAAHMQYPAAAQQNGIQGRVTVLFVVTSTGEIGEVKVARGKHPALDAEAVRVVKSLPRFTPGKMNGKPVNVWYTLPMTFKLQN